LKGERVAAAILITLRCKKQRQQPLGHSPENVLISITRKGDAGHG